MWPTGAVWQAQAPWCWPRLAEAACSLRQDTNPYPSARPNPNPNPNPEPKPEPNPARAGEHAAHWASEFGPAYTFQPTELDADALDSIRLYAQGLANVAPPLLLDTAAEAERRGSPHLNPSPSLNPLT